MLDGRKPPANSPPIRVDIAPGSKWRYSDGGFTVAQLLVMGNYGLGMEVKGGGRNASFSHGGSNEGFRCQMFAYRETGQGAVIMTNCESGGPLIDEIMRSIAAEYGWPDYNVAEREVVKVDPKIYESYAGE